MNRHRLLIAACVAAYLGLTGVAGATTTTSTFQGSVSPTKAGTKKAPKNVTLKASASIQTDDGTQPPQATTILLGLDRNIVINAKDFVVKGCTAARLNDSKNIDDPKCAKAKIGRATAIAMIDQSPLTFDTRLYAGSSKSIITVVKQTAGIGCCSNYAAFDSPIISLSKPYGKGFNIAIDKSLLQPLPGLYPSLTALNNVTMGATKRVPKRVKVNGRFRTKNVSVRFLSSVGCASAKYNLRNVFKFHSTPKVPSPGPDLTKDITTACRK
jgi:hypothetical protein